jgi:hypothetical protein
MNIILCESEYIHDLISQQNFIYGCIIGVCGGSL